MIDANSDLDLGKLVSERRNPRTIDVDLLPVTEILERINDEDRLIADAVRAEMPSIAKAVDQIVQAFRAGGRLIYIGAGTSGRLGVLDASECPPTFSVPDDMVIGVIAGGDHALRNAVEGAEDDAEQGAEDLRALNLGPNDAVVGIAVSGRTPYVIGALQYAQQVGAATVGLTCNPGSPIAEQAAISIAPLVGPEVLTGSTRLKSGTAQKLVLNMMSTAAMIRMGKTYENLMVDLSASNAKLRERAVGILREVTECTDAEARDLLRASGNSVKLAILMQLTGLNAVEARERLDAADGFLRRAI